MKRYFTFALALLAGTVLTAQSPEKFSYQAVIRKADNSLLINQPVGIRISIIQGSIDGVEIYKEVFVPNPQTNQNGLVSLEIGTGLAVVGNFSDIQWENGPYFLKTDTDPLGGTSYSISAISQLLSVPYALYAKSAASLSDPVTESDPVFFSSQAANITSNDITKLHNLSGINTGDQDLSGFLKNETDPEYSSSPASGITAWHIGKWNGKQDPLTAGNGIDITDNVISASSAGYYIGQPKDGGIIGYLYKDLNGQEHGLILSLQLTIAAWSNPGFSIGNTRSWDGKYNTSLMYDSPAKTYVQSLGEGWYIPAMDEINAIWNNRLLVNKALFEGNYPIFGNLAYYTSNEADISRAFYFNAQNGNIDMVEKNVEYFVRAIRSF